MNNVPHLHMEASKTNTNTSGGEGIGAKQATGKQLVAIIFILALAAKMFMLPIFLIQSGGRDGYIALAIGGGLDLVALAAMLVAMYISRDTDFFTLLGSVIGKVGAKIFVALLALYMFFKLNIAASESLAFYADTVFTDFNTSVMIVALLIFFAAVANHTLRALCRLNELLIPLIVLCIAILIAIVVMTGFDFANIFPAMQDASAFRTTLFSHVSWMGDFTPLVLFIGRTKLKKRTTVFAAVSGVIGTAVAVFFALVLCAAFGNVPVLVDSSTNLSSILQFSIGNVYGKIDMFSSVLWSISAFIESALLFYATCRCIAFVIGKNAHFIIALCVCVALYMSVIFAMSDPMIFSVVTTSSVSSIISLVFVFVTPALALVCAVIKEKRTKNQSEAAQ